MNDVLDYLDINQNEIYETRDGRVVLSSGLAPAQYEEREELEFQKHEKFMQQINSETREKK